MLLSRTVRRPRSMINDRGGKQKNKIMEKKFIHEKYTLVNRIERVKKFPFATTVFQRPVVQLHGITFINKGYVAHNGGTRGAL